MEVLACAMTGGLARYLIELFLASKLLDAYAIDPYGGLLDDRALRNGAGFCLCLSRAHL